MNAQTKFEVRRLTKEFLPDVAILETLCFHNPWTEKGLELLLCDHALGAAVIVGGHTVSYAGMMIAADECEITNVATHPDYRGRGFARAAMMWLIDYAKSKGLVQMSLEVRESNAAAIVLYKSLGFTTAGKRPHFYREPPEAALVMLLKL